jgi:hypothetical protein
VQQCIWETEEGDHCDLDVLKRIASRCGIDEEGVKDCVRDNRSDHDDPGVIEWTANHEEAKKLGESAPDRSISLNRGRDLWHAKLRTEWGDLLGTRQTLDDGDTHQGAAGGWSACIISNICVPVGSSIQHPNLTGSPRPIAFLSRVRLLHLLAPQPVYVLSVASNV